MFHRMRASSGPLAAVCLSLFVAPLRADLRLAGIFGDHMVVQRDADLRVWGQADPGELIVVRPSWYENDAAVTAKANGRFEVLLHAPGAGGPHRIRFAGKNQVELADLWSGEVWLASGQSNMEMGVGYQHEGYTGVADFERELAAADRPRIRFFTVNNAIAATAQADLRGTWTVATPASARDFSATAWFFACRLEHELDVPVGIVAADWGGTPVEAWMSPSSLAPFDDFRTALANLAKLAADPRAFEAEALAAEARFQSAFDAVDPLLPAASPNFDDSSWPTRPVPGGWTGELEAFDGALWMRRTIEIPADWAGRELELSLGPIDDDDSAWFQGERVGSSAGWSLPRRYRVPSRLVKAGPATVAVRIVDTGGLGGFHGAASDIYLAPLDRAGPRGAARVELAGSWRSQRGLEWSRIPARESVFSLTSDVPSSLFNGMVAPLAGLRLAGALWYQGESNIGRAEQYSRSFPALIEGWRAHFRAPRLPFLFVQIAPFGYGFAPDWPGDLRAAQAAALRLPATAMVITADVGDPADIHPKRKREVGERLAAFALRDVYGREAVCAAPVPAGVERREGAIVVRFAPSPLEAPEALESCGPSAFELAGSDGRFLPAEQTVEGESVVVRSAAVFEPQQVRYAWQAAAAGSIRGRDSRLPVAPFLRKVD